MNKSYTTMPAIVGIMLVTIFAILCMSIFTVLVLTSYYSASGLTDASTAHITAYYEADSAGEAILAELRQGDVPEGVADLGGGIYEYSCPLSDGGSLEIRVRVASADDYEILRWQLITGQDWAIDDAITLWDGESPLFE